MVGGRSRSPHHEAGHALGLAMIVLLLLSTGVSLLAADLAARLRNDREAAEDLTLRLLSDAGVARALAALDQSEQLGIAPETVGRGTIESQGHRLALPGRWRLEVTAKVNRRQRRVEVEVMRVGSTLRVVRWARLGDFDDGEPR